jgi:hypothetical protein
MPTGPSSPSLARFGTRQIAGHAAIALALSATAALAKPDESARAVPSAPIPSASLAAREPAPDAGVTTQREPLLDRRGQIALLVDESRMASEAVARLAESQGGELGEQAERQVVIRVPAARLGAVITRLGGLGTIRHRSMTTRDIGPEQADLGARLASAIQTRERLLALEQRAQSVDDSLLVERRLALVDEEIARLRAASIAIERRGKLATLTVLLMPRADRTPENVREPGLPFPWLDRMTLSDLLHTEQSSGHDGDEVSRQIDTNLDLALQLEGTRLDGMPNDDDRAYAVAAALRMRGVIGTDPLGIALGTDLALGGGEGFLYDVGLMLGLGSSIGEYSSLGLMSGLGHSGWTGDHVKPGLDIPVELFMTLEGGDVARLLLFAQPRWAFTHSRDDGSPNTPFGDELSLGGAVLIPALFGNDELDEGGLRIGGVYTEVGGTRAYTVTLGMGAGAVDH